MKIEIKEASVTVSGLAFALSKLDFRLLPGPLATLFVPYAEADRLMVANIRCPGVEEPAVFTGIQSERPITGQFSGKLIAVKHGMRGISFDVLLDNIKFDWSHDAGAKEGRSENAQEHERGIDTARLVESGCFIPSDAEPAAEAPIEQCS